MDVQIMLRQVIGRLAPHVKLMAAERVAYAAFIASCDEGSRSPDLQSFASWLLSGEEDFLIAEETSV